MQSSWISYNVRKLDNLDYLDFKNSNLLWDKFIHRINIKVSIKSIRIGFTWILLSYNIYR